VVADENANFFTTTRSVLRVWKNSVAVAVLPVPGAPTMSAGYLIACSRCRRTRACTVSIVGIKMSEMSNAPTTPLELGVMSFEEI
jgi:hypothetical protein